MQSEKTEALEEDDLKNSRTPDGVRAGGRSRTDAVRPPEAPEPGAVYIIDDADAKEVHMMRCVRFEHGVWAFERVAVKGYARHGLARAVADYATSLQKAARRTPRFVYQRPWEIDGALPLDRSQWPSEDVPLIAIAPGPGRWYGPGCYRKKRGRAHLVFERAQDWMEYRRRCHGERLVFEGSYGANLPDEGAQIEAMVLFQRLAEGIPDGAGSLRAVAARLSRSGGPERSYVASIGTHHGKERLHIVEIEVVDCPPEWESDLIAVPLMPSSRDRYARVLSAFAADFPSMASRVRGASLDLALFFKTPDGDVRCDYETDRSPGDLAGLTGLWRLRRRERAAAEAAVE